MTDHSAFTVTAEWLSENLNREDISIVDASWYLPAAGRDGYKEYLSGHIPGAVFFDMEKIADKSSNLPHTMPSPEFFAEQVGALGIRSEDMIIVYDGPGLFSSARVWWMFRTMGAKRVFILDGGIDSWKKLGLPVTDQKTQKSPVEFIPHFSPDAIVSFAEMREIVDQHSAQIADARSPGRFTGKDPEPRAGMRSGHMPGAKNVPATSLAENGKLKTLPELRQIFADAGIDLNQPVVTSCGSGVTAAVISLALTSLGHDKNRLYDGSWSEWGSHTDTPVVTGDAD